MMIPSGVGTPGRSLALESLGLPSHDHLLVGGLVTVLRLALVVGLMTGLHAATENLAEIEGLPVHQGSCL